MEDGHRDARGGQERMLARALLPPRCLLAGRRLVPESRQLSESADRSVPVATVGGT